jgi:hypothetical protein
LATLTLAAGRLAAVSGALPQALITTTANRANGKRKCLNDCSMDASANVLRLANDARQGDIARIEWGEGNYHSE